MDDSHTRLRIVVLGVVQGVGFRPFVHRTATRLGLDGSVRNSSRGVTLEVEGDPVATRDFVNALRHHPPPLSRIEQIDVEEIPVTGEPGFHVLASIRSADPAEQAILVPPDVATCAACLAEMGDPSDRRHGYPFINCTDCGPRFTIIDGLPYDRPLTSMRQFELCPACLAEYQEIADRRYHAQPVACPACGPQIWLTDNAGSLMECDDPITATARELERGGIAAIKGLGGFHLACDASNDEAVEQMRRRKRRPHKPFAVMAVNLGAVERFARVTDAERMILEGWRRPIVLLSTVPTGPLSAHVGGASGWVGVMLPYTPLHHQLLAEADCPALVMTSGNQRDEPIVIDNEDAVARLGGVVDLFLLHDRPILNRADDAVVAVIPAVEEGDEATLSPVRRSRGYVPDPVILPRRSPAPVLAVGGDLKNTCCLVRGQQAILSQHIGDLENPAASEMLASTAHRLTRLFGVDPQLVVHDLHPDYGSTRLAEELGLPRLAVQHHHAHALACIAEHGQTEPVLAVVLDGTGLGTDRAIWGGELLRVEGLAFDRLGHLRYLALPGGDQAARQPWRMALAALAAAYGPDLPVDLRDLPPFLAADPILVSGVLDLIGKTDAVVPPTSSTGRLFDAIASVLDLRHETTFEGQAAMELEQLASECDADDCLPWTVDEQGIIDLMPGVRALVKGLADGQSKPVLARAFHSGLAAALVEATARAASQSGLKVVALSGGSLQNRILHRLLVRGLKGQGLEVLTHREVPPNDGGLALGQAWAGVLQLSGRTKQG